MKENLITQSVSYAVRGILIASFLVFLWRGNLSSAFSTAMIFLLVVSPWFLRRWFNFRTPPILEAAVGTFVFATLFLGEMENFYYKYNFWDSILHFESGLILGTIGYILIYVLNGAKRVRFDLTPVFASVFAFCFSVSLGAFWEVYEFLMDTFLGRDMQHGGLPDTMYDIIFNMVGSLIVTGIGFYWIRRTSRIPLTHKKLDG